MYEGEWAADAFHGQGVWTTVAGDRFEGSFREGAFHGAGSMVSANGDKCAPHITGNHRTCSHATLSAPGIASLSIRWSSGRAPSS